MNRHIAYNLPTIFYSVLLLAAWLLSWLSGFVELIDGGVSGLNILTNAEGVRYAVREALPAVESVPWGAIILLLCCVGLFHGSGLPSLFGNIFRLRPLTVNQSRAGLSALVILLFYLLLLFMCSVSPWRLLMGVTGDIYTSPMARGWLLLLFVGTLFVSATYGYVYGNYRSLYDVLAGVSHTLSAFVPAFIAMLPAAWLVATMHYMGLFALWGLNDAVTDIFAAIIYLLPYIFVGCLRVYYANK